MPTAIVQNNPPRTNKWNGSAVRRALDDTIICCLNEEHPMLERQNWLFDSVLALMIMAVGIALVAMIWDTFYPFPESQQVLQWCIIAYFAIAIVLALFKIIFLRSNIFTGIERIRRNGVRIRKWIFSSEMVNNSDMYKVTIKVNVQDRSIQGELTKSCANYIDENGVVLVDLIANDFNEKIRILRVKLDGIQPEPENEEKEEDEVHEAEQEQRMETDDKEKREQQKEEKQEQHKKNEQDQMEEVVEQMEEEEEQEQQEQQQEQQEQELEQQEQEQQEREWQEQEQEQQEQELEQQEQEQEEQEWQDQEQQEMEWQDQEQLGEAYQTNNDQCESARENNDTTDDDNDYDSDEESDGETSSGYDYDGDYDAMDPDRYERVEEMWCPKKSNFNPTNITI